MSLELLGTLVILASIGTAVAAFTIIIIRTNREK